MGRPTKAELHAELDRRGLAYSPDSSNAELETLLEHAQGVPAELEDQAQAEAGQEPEAEVALYPRRLVKHTYQSGDAEVTRYGLVVDPDGPLVAWLPVEHVGHLELEGL